MLLKVFTLLCLYSVSAAKYDKKTADGVTFTQWLSLMVSRGIYLVLLGLILLCILISAYRNRKQNKIRDEISKTRKAVLSEVTEDNSWITNLWKGPQMFSLQGNDFLNRNRRNPLLELVEPSDLDTESMKEKLREAEVMVSALKEELEIANNVRLDLESSMETVERDKSYSEEELRQTKLNSSLELEEMKKEISILQRQLNQAQTEKSQLSKELEAVARENRITDSALRDQQNLALRLDEAKVEIKSLKDMMDSMRSERDAAVKIASELVAKARGVTKESMESRKLIREILEGSSKGSLFSMDVIGDGPNANFGSSDIEWRQEDEGDTSRDDIGNTNEYDGGEKDLEEIPFDAKEFIIDSDSSFKDDSAASRLVTNSPEFRAFLQATFRVNSALAGEGDD